ncbi:hypothetical protein CLV49_3146 [Labedella gwakjiensis]|uniref:Uncharacterized protein n=1 Tax=Labedella gwakjiensis TaxID=390269 RepID=A0A2P8GZW7_9MICO|nr:hypothetical protein [Labedella gwakjiensis]PSL39506.1 hypothetical protein CLV49_3146 [Labedella gwakjiensis]RUQ86095.1 hypothetical protein ELQ93_03525 [Labedella gwakjiensis]
MSIRRTIESPHDLEDGWFVVVDDDGDREVAHFSSAEYARIRDRRKAADESHLDHDVVEVEGWRRYRVGDSIELASGEALEDGFRRSVRKLWLPSITLPVYIVGLFLLDLTGLPWRTDLARQLFIGAACASPSSSSSVPRCGG